MNVWRPAPCFIAILAVLLFGAPAKARNDITATQRKGPPETIV